MIGQRPACELDCVSRMIIACSAGGIRERVFFCVWKRSHFNSLPKQKHSSEIPPATQGEWGNFKVNGHFQVNEDLVNRSLGKSRVN